MVLSALLDFFSLASFLPLFVLLVNPGFISTNKYAALLYNTFGFTSPTWFIGTLAIAVLILTATQKCNCPVDHTLEGFLYVHFRKSPVVTYAIPLHGR